MAPATSRSALRSLILCFIVLPPVLTLREGYIAARDRDERNATWSSAPPEIQARLAAKIAHRDRLRDRPWAGRFAVAAACGCRGADLGETPLEEYRSTGCVSPVPERDDR